MTCLVTVSRADGSVVPFRKYGSICRLDAEDLLQRRGHDAGYGCGEIGGDLPLREAARGHVARVGRDPAGQQEQHDVTLRERWLGREIEDRLGEPPGDVQGDLVRLHAGGGLDVPRR